MNSKYFFFKQRYLLPFTLPVVTQRSCSLQNLLVKVVPKVYLKEANWMEVMQLQHNLCFTNTSPICHGISWLWEAFFHTSDCKEFSESLEKPKQPKNIHLLFLSSTHLPSYSSTVTCCLLVRAKVWYTLCFCVGSPQHNDSNILSNSQGGAGIPCSSLWKWKSV